MPLCAEPGAWPDAERNPPTTEAWRTAGGGAGERDLWLSRYAAFQVASGVSPEHAARARDKIAAELAVLTPQEDGAILREAGFRDVRVFYVGFAVSQHKSTQTFKV